MIEKQKSITMALRRREEFQTAGRKRDVQKASSHLLHRGRRRTGTELSLNSSQQRQDGLKAQESLSPVLQPRRQEEDDRQRDRASRGQRPGGGASTEWSCRSGPGPAPRSGLCPLASEHRLRLPGRRWSSPAWPRTVQQTQHGSQPPSVCR